MRLDALLPSPALVAAAVSSGCGVGEVMQVWSRTILRIARIQAAYRHCANHACMNKYRHFEMAGNSPGSVRTRSRMQVLRCVSFLPRRTRSSHRSHWTMRRPQVSWWSSMSWYRPATAHPSWTHLNTRRVQTLVCWIQPEGLKRRAQPGKGQRAVHCTRTLHVCVLRGCGCGCGCGGGGTGGGDSPASPGRAR